MGKQAWTKEQEDYLRYLYSKDCTVFDFVTTFNQKFNTNRTKNSLIHKAHKLEISSDFNGGSRYNYIKNKADNEKRIGQINISNDGTLMKIIEYTGATHVLIEFQDEFKYQMWVTYSNFTKGTIKNPYCKQLYGRGYLGVGQYKPYIQGHQKSKAHDAWIRMFDRCYNEKYHKVSPTYIGCEVCKEWYNFQVFAKWFYDNYYEVPDQSIEVEKDWLSLNNKIYSPETCCLSPNIINTCILCHDKKINFNMPIGVRPNGYGKYVARCSVEGKRVILGTFSTPKDAENAYWKFKIKYVESLAEKYKDVIPEKLYLSLMDYKNTYVERALSYGGVKYVQ